MERVERGYNADWLWAIVCAITMMFIAFMLGSIWGAKHVSVAPPDTDRKYRESATLEMIRLGAMDWQAACAWSMGHDGATSATMYRACTVRYGIGEPLHEERRAGK